VISTVLSFGLADRIPTVTGGDAMAGAAEFPQGIAGGVGGGLLEITGALDTAAGAGGVAGGANVPTTTGEPW